MCLGLTTVADADAKDGSAEPPFRFYSVADGLTQSEVYDIEQDGAGHLWFTTARGFNRFDGRDFTSFTIADGLPDNRLTALEIDAHNNIWVGDERGGMTLLRGGKISEVIAPAFDQPAPVIDIETSNGITVAIVEGQGIVQVVGEPGASELRIIDGSEPDGHSLVEHQGGLWFVAGDYLHSLMVRPQPTVRRVLADIVMLHAGPIHLWAVDGRNRLGRIVDNDFQPLFQIPVDEPLTALQADGAGTVWASTETLLLEMTGLDDGGEPTVRHFSGFDQLSSLFIDREHTLWLSSSSRLGRYLGDRFEHFKLQSEAEPETIWSITQDPQGRMWFGTQDHLIIRNADETLTVLDESRGLPSGAVRDLVADRSGFIWAGVRNHGIYRISPDTLETEFIEATAGLGILDLDASYPGAVWITTYKSGVFRYRVADDELDAFPVENGAPVYSIDVADDGSVWFGADDVGLIHLVPQPGKDALRSVFGKSAGLEHHLFNHIRLTSDGHAWVATEEGGLYRFNGSRFESFGNGKPYSDQTVYLVEELANGTVIVGGEQGLYHFMPGGERTVHYNQMSGFLGLETNVHATFLDAGDSLWIGTIDGVSRMNASMGMPPEVQLTPQIVGMRSLIGDRNIAEGDELPSGSEGLTVEFAAVSLSNPRSIELSYLLEGVDSNWGSPTTNRMVEYTRVPPGTHRFKVRARHPGEPWSDAIAARQFTVNPFFWQRLPVILATLALVAVLIRAAFVYRTRHIKRVNRTLMEQVSERTKSIEEAKRNLQLTNERLTREIDERRKSDEARAEVETRFRKAFENAPIGMGLLDDEGRLFDANPALEQMLWPSAERPGHCLFSETIGASHEQHFRELFEDLVGGKIDHIDERFDCVDTSDRTLHTALNISTVQGDDGRFMYAVIQVQDHTEALQLTNRLERQARYDELTGLFNRRAFEQELARAWEVSRESGEHSFLLYMDLDQFKVVNDTSGHAAGDELLQQLAEILRANVRGNDTIGRMGGDEFAIILWKCPLHVAARIAETIRAAVEDFRFQWDVETYKVGVSVGGVTLDAGLGDISEIQQLADSACFTAKEDGRNRVHIVDGEKDSARAHRRQIRWVQRLREAMDNNRFAIYAQEMKSLDPRASDLPRFEVLLRLRDPETRRLIPPGAFLPAAERYGLSRELDEWVIRNVMDALFVHQAFQAEQRRFWINLSGTSIGEKRFAAFLRNAIEHSPLPPGTINFEITETAIIRNVTQAGHLIGELREMGCEFALDDFGNGLSSFGYLRKLPVSSLKVDGMFIRNIATDETDRIFVRSIIDIAHTLDMQTTCELIENNEMLEVVRDLGADFAQGFAVARPFELAPCFPETNAPDAVAPDVQKKAG